MRIASTDFSTPTFFADPYPTFNHIREVAPAVWYDDNGCFLVGRYDDCDRILRDKRFGREASTVMTDEERANQPALSEELKTIAALQRSMMLVRDPPVHTRLRNLVNKAFTPRMIYGLHDRIQQIADRLLDTVEMQGGMDVIADFALPLPIAVVAEMLGIPTGDERLLRKWSEHLLGTNDLVPASARRLQLTVEANLALGDYLRDLIAQKRANPADDLLSALIAAKEDDCLSEDELIATTLLILCAGFETTTNLIGNGIWLLLKHLGQFEQVKANPALVPCLIQEALRLQPPVLGTGRVVMEDTTIGDIHLERLQRLIILIAAANRDPRKYSDPDTFNVSRSEAKPLSFGNGIHHCLGAPLAGMEGEIAFTTLLRRMPNLQLASQSLQWREMILVRGLQELPVTF